MTHKQDIADAISGGKKPQYTPEALKNIPSNPETILCIYHGNCPDGFGAAWAMRHWLPNAKIEFHAAKYGDSQLPNYKGRIVYVLDFSFPRLQTIDMIEKSKAFLLLDHHKTAMENLVGLDWSPQGLSPREYQEGMRFFMSDGGRIVIDMDKSGAGLSWDYFSGMMSEGGKGTRRPPLIDHIEDGDLWKFKWALS